MLSKMIPVCLITLWNTNLSMSYVSHNMRNQRIIIIVTLYSMLEKESTIYSFIHCECLVK